jgi:Clostripain family
MMTGSSPANGKPKWTVMVFMGADNLPNEEDLSDEAQKDIAELRKAMKAPGTNDALDVFVQLHGKGFVTRERIGKGGPVAVALEEQQATNGIALTAFMKSALRTARHHPSDHSMLVLWGHAYRFGIGRAATRTGIDALDFAELAAVLRNLQEEEQKIYDLEEVPKLDIVGFDACDLASIEMAYQLHPFARYLLASQIGIPLPGWPYHRILDRIRNPQGARVMGPAEFGTYIVRRFCEAYQAQQREVTLTLLDLQRAPELRSLTEALARTLAIAMARDFEEQERVYDLFRRSATTNGAPFVDVADLCLNLTLNSSDPAVTKAATALGDFLVTPAPVKPGESATGEGRPFVVEHGRNTGRTARLNGVNLYAPHVRGDSHDWMTASHAYEKFVFAQETLWSELVQALALPS